MPRLLLISGVFPPLPHGGASQMGQRVKYLARAGWEVDVLTPEIPPGANVDADPVLPDGVTVHRTNFLFQSSRPSLRHDKERSTIARGLGGLGDLLSVPGGYLRWLPSAIRAGKALAREADAILSANNPITTHAVARSVARSSQTPWIAELRDPIAGYRHSHRGPEAMNQWFERQVVRRAHGVVQWGDFIPEPVGDRYPEFAEKFLVIPYSGYDADDYCGYQHSAPAGGPLQICYTGSFYGDHITPTPFLKALARYLNKQDARSIGVTLAGDWSPEYDEIVREHGLDDVVGHVGRVSKQACIDLWRQSHVLLLILSGEGDDVNRIPSKFWDYVGARATILALVAPEGRLANLVRSEGLGIVAAPTDVEAIEGALAELVDRHRRRVLSPEPSAEFLNSAACEGGEFELSRFIARQAGLDPLPPPGAESEPAA